MSKTSHSVLIAHKEWYAQDIFGLKVRFPRRILFPGQFFQIQVSDCSDPFLNRPISIASYRRGLLHLIIRVVGRGTRIMSEKREGEELKLLGPFGKGMKLPRKKSLLIAGGIGVAPLMFVAQHLKQTRTPFSFLYGTGHAQELILKDEIRRMSDRSVFVAEYGMKKKMTVLQLLKSYDMDDHQCAYACGPSAMLIELQRMSLPMPVYAFCEDFLGCGCGLCLGCAIKYQGAYKRICEDGPVFELNGIDFNG